MMRRSASLSWPILALLLFSTLIFFGCGSEEKSTVLGPTGEDLEFNPEPLRIGVVGTDWTKTLTPTGGSTPYSYAISLGDLPPGLAYQGASTNLTIEGTPNTAGTYNFTIEVTDKEGEKVLAGFAIIVVEEIDISGTWNYTMTVDYVEGNCGEAVGTSHTHSLTITQTGSEVVFSGFFGQPTSQLTGEILNGALYDVHVSGSYPEGGGTLNGTHQLYVYSPTMMGGVETWSWSDGGSSCSNSTAVVSATRVRKGYH